MVAGLVRSSPVWVVDHHVAPLAALRLLDVGPGTAPVGWASRGRCSRPAHLLRAGTYAEEMLEVMMQIQETPADASGLNPGPTDTLTTTAETYEDALAQLERQIPHGWRSTSILVERPATT